MFSQNQPSRTHESPMDFEWHGQSHGPTDPNSPFPKLKPGQKGGFNPTPISSSFQVASSKVAPQFRNPSFTTPRKGTFDLDIFSEASGIDSSPGDVADGEDTPDLPKNNKMTAFSNAHPEKQPIFGRYGTGFIGSSPGRADLRRGKYANAVIANKARKRKRIERDYSLARGNQESDSESEDDSGDRTKGKSKSNGSNWLGSFLSGVEARPNLPSIIAYWLQLSLNLFLLLLAVYILLSFWLTIRSDVDKASEAARRAAVSEMSQCQKDFVDNRCGSNPTPALVLLCQEWGHCMERDPEMVLRARISAHTFAEILNDFIEPISWKAMIFMALILTMCILVNNLAFGMFRSKNTHAPPVNPFFHQPPPQNYQWGAPPQTPQHNGGYDIYGNQGFQHIMPSHTPGQRSPSKEMRSVVKGNRSPSKGDRY